MNARIVALIDLVTYFIHDHFLFQVKVTQTIAGFDDPQEVRKLKRGDYFGEKSLLRWVNNESSYSHFVNVSLE